MSTTTLPAIGARMPDGTTYAGISPDTGRPMFTIRQDISCKCSFYVAADIADSLDVHGRRDWIVPSVEEAKVMCERQASIGGFDYGWYWTSEAGPELHHRQFETAKGLHFGDGRLADFKKGSLHRMRPIRYGPKP